MNGMEGPLIFMGALFGLMALVWVAGHLDQAVQKMRGVEPNQNGRVPDGWIAKIVLAVVIGGVAVWYIGSGGANIDPEFTYRRQ